MSDIANNTALTDNLVSVWLTDSSGLTTDLHGSNTLTSVNSPTLTTGQQGDAADYEASSTQYSKIDSPPAGLKPNELTIACWVNFETTGTGAFASIYGIGSARSYLFDLDGTDLRLVAQFGGSLGVKQVTWSPSAATWYHIGVSHDSATGDVKFFVNGSQQGATQSAGTGALTYGSAPFNIGARNNGTTPFDGVINQVCFWDTNKADSIFSTLYNSGSGIPYEAAAGPSFTPKVMWFS